MIFIYAIIAAAIGLAGTLFLAYSDDIIVFTNKVSDKIFGSYDSKNKKHNTSANTPVEGSPLAGSSLTKDMKQAIEPLLLSWENADSSYLTGRMDTTFRQMQENSIRLLQRHGLRRVIRLQKTKMRHTGKPGNFRNWNDGGRQWREGVAEGSIRDTYVDASGRTVNNERIRSARIAVRQSRHIRCQDLAAEKEGRRQGKKGNTEFYEEVREQRCYSCGAEITISGAETTCPFCGRAVFSNFYDWQTQDFVIENDGFGKTFLTFLPVAPITFIMTLLIFLPFMDVIEGDIAFSLMLLAGGVIVGLFVTLVVLFLFEDIIRKNSKTKKITRFSENLFRSSILEELWKRADPETTLEMYLGEIKYKSVKNTEDQSFITAAVPLRTRTIDSSGKISTSTTRKRLKMVRARYPNKLKSQGEILVNRSCPSCAVPFLPDDHGACSYCGYSLQVDNSKWKITE